MSDRGRRRAERKGRFAETLSAWWLRLGGWRILARRYTAPGGEADLIARRGRVLAIVEVKARATQGAAREALGRRQRKRIERAAASFLARHPKFATLTVRFDVMLVSPGRLPRHISDAWRPE